jgi:hypothetical protein
MEILHVSKFRLLKLQQTISKFMYEIFFSWKINISSSWIMQWKQTDLLLYILRLYSQKAGNFEQRGIVKIVLGLLPQIYMPIIAF